MKVYLVENIHNRPGFIYAIFANEDDANMLAKCIEHKDREVCAVSERTLFYGQPQNCGYNE